MKKTSFIYLLLLIALGLSSCQQEKTFKVLQFNIWQEGAVVKGGFDAIADEIVRSNADFGLWKRCSKEDKRTILSTPRIPVC